MNCMEVKKQMDNLVEKPNLSAELPGVQEHLQQCAVCREELQNATESIHLLAQMPRITPEAEFTAAWKSRIRSESAKQSSAKSFLAFLTMPALRPVLGTAMAVVIGLGVYTVVTKTPQSAKVVPLGNQVQNRTMVALGQDAATGTYELQIMEVGLKGKVTKNDLLSRISSYTKGYLKPSQINSIVTGDWDALKNDMQSGLYDKMVSMGLTPAEAETILVKDWAYLDTLSRDRLAEAISKYLGITQEFSQAIVARDLEKVKEYGKVELATAALSRLLGANQVAENN